MKRLLYPLALVLLHLHGSAQSFISGTVVDAALNPVPSVNINAFDLAGNELDLANDGTNAMGQFTTTVIDGPGLYLIEFVPPVPPTTTHLVKHVPNIAVGIGTTNMGQIVLAPGVSLTGRTVRSGPIAVPNINLSVLDGGVSIPLHQLKTNPFGLFTLAVPAHAIELRLDSTSAAVVLASKAYDLSPTGNTNLGDLLLPPGQTITGQVRRPNGTVVNGVDLDFRNTATGIKEYTPNDNSDTLGNFSVVVAAGTYDVEFCPPASEPLAGKVLPSQILTGPTNLGIVSLQAGIHLSGTITHAGSPVVGADLDLFQSVGGAELFLCNDNSNASGVYSVYVPAGTYDAVFTPPSCSTLAPATQLSVVVNTSTVLNAVLPTFAATSGIWIGDGINVDAVAPVNMVIGQNWNAPLTLGHSHGASGPANLKVRTGTVNGPNFVSPIGGRPIENLINGPVLAILTGSHNGSTGGIPTFPIPNDACLVGIAWSAQYTVLGGGFADLSRAVFGVIGAQ